LNDPGRGHIHPQPAHKHGIPSSDNHFGLWSTMLLPFRPVLSAYGGLASILERVRVGMVMTMPEINIDVTMGVAKVIPGEKAPFCTQEKKEVPIYAALDTDTFFRVVHSLMTFTHPPVCAYDTGKICAQ